MKKLILSFATAVFCVSSHASTGNSSSKEAKWENVLSDFAGGTYVATIINEEKFKTTYSLTVIDTRSLVLKTVATASDGTIAKTRIEQYKMEGNMHLGPVVLTRTEDGVTTPVGICDGYFCNISTGRGAPMSGSGFGGNMNFTMTVVFSDDQVVFHGQLNSIIAGNIPPENPRIGPDGIAIELIRSETVLITQFKNQIKLVLQRESK